jgi:hypothetical protein
VAHAEHPLIAAHGTNAAAYLVGQGLECKTLVGRRQSAGQGVTWSLGLNYAQKLLNGLLEPAMEQVFVALERD